MADNIEKAQVLVALEGGQLKVNLAWDETMKTVMRHLEAGTGENRVQFWERR